MADYVITVVRRTKDSGKLHFYVDGTEQFATDRWWEADNPIPGKHYTGCSTTLMATRGYKSVYLPDAQTGRKGIFIHQGTGPGNSTGCIVCAKSKVETIYDTVPRNGWNILVIVSPPG